MAVEGGTVIFWSIANSLILCRFSDMVSLKPFSSAELGICNM